MNPRLAFVLVLVASLTSSVFAQNLVYGSRSGDKLEITDLTANALFTSDLTVAGGTVSGIHALARNPVDGDLYVIGEFSGFGHVGRALGRLGPIGCTTAVTLIGDTGEQIASMAFDGTGTCYALSGDGGNTTETLFTANLATGALTLIAALGNGNDGESIGFNSNDGLLYHQSGRNGGDIWESVVPATGMTTNIGFAVPSPSEDEFTGMTFDAVANLFYAIDLDEILWSVTPGGLKTNLGTVVPSTGGQPRGLAITDVQFPGTAGDFVTRYEVNLGGLTPLVGGTDSVCLAMGDAMTVQHDSPGGGQYFAGEVIAIGSVTTDLGVIVEPFPGLHVGGSLISVIGGAFNGIPLLLGPGGVSYSFVYGGGLAGTSVMVQAVVLSGALATNGIFESANGLVVSFD